MKFTVTDWLTDWLTDWHKLKLEKAQFNPNCQDMAEEPNSQILDGETKEEESHSQESGGFGSTRSFKNKE